MTVNDLVKILIRSNKQSIGLMEESLDIPREDKTVLIKRSKFLASLSTEELSQVLKNNRRRKEQNRQ